MEFENFVGTRKEIEKLLGLSLDNIQFPQLEKSCVPEALWELIPYAETFGISDDILRDKIVENSPRELLNKLKTLIVKYDDELDDWLAGPEAISETPTAEYVAFSAMRMASDVATLLGR